MISKLANAFIQHFEEHGSVIIVLVTECIKSSEGEPPLNSRIYSCIPDNTRISFEIIIEFTISFKIIMSRKLMQRNLIKIVAFWKELRRVYINHYNTESK